MKVSKEKYDEAIKTRDEAEKIIQEYHLQEINDFHALWAKHEAGEYYFKDEELRFSAGATCDECQAGLAYPVDCSPHHWWSCSANLKGEVKEKHGTYAFAFYSIKSEDQPSANGHTTRPKP